MRRRLPPASFRHSRPRQKLLVATAEAEADDLAWAKPYVDRARADGDRGDTISLSELKARMSVQREQFER